MANRKVEPRGKAFWPVLGFLLALSSGALAWVFTPSVLDFLKKSLSNFPRVTPTISLIVGGIIFVVLALLFSVIVAFAVPRKKSAVTEIQMAKDRNLLVREKAARKVRQREINRQNKAR